MIEMTKHLLNWTVILLKSQLYTRKETSSVGEAIMKTM